MRLFGRGRGHGASTVTKRRLRTRIPNSATLRQDPRLRLALAHAMTDYLDARVRYRSESVNTDASGTAVSPLPTPFINARPTPLIYTKAPTNTILKSHGRPPWYCPCLPGINDS